MSKLLLFDVDGTITESGQCISDEMKEIIQNIKQYYDIGIVGGGQLNKILNQLGNDNYFHHYFTECGCVYHENISKSNELKLLHHYTKNIREHKLYLNINLLIKTALKFISNVDYTITGNFIDLRNGIVYISLLGMSANILERKEYIELDKKFNYRKSLLNILYSKAKELNISSEITICQGGSVGIAIYPIEYDKNQVLEHLDKYQEIHYFGDKYEENGNDYNLINNKNIIGHRINSIEETKNLLINLLIQNK